MLSVRTGPSVKPSPQAGFSLVELMVAMLLSLLLLGGVLAIFASSRKTYETTDQLSRIQENGRFALDVIVRDLRGAGFTGCSKRSAFSSSLTLVPATSLLWDFELPIEGFDGQGSAWLPATTDPTTVATSADSAGDVLAIRLPRGEFEPQRLTTFMALPSSPVQIANVAPALVNANDIVQVADCQSRAVFQVTGNAAGALAHANVAATSTTPGNASADLGAAFTEQSELVAMRSVVYFLRTGNTPGAGLSLWRRVSGTTAPEEVVEGVESLQFQYGEDTDGDNVIAVDEYRTANLVSDWNQVLSVRIALLVRSLSEYGNDTDARAYQVLERNIPAPGDRRLRQIFTTTVTLRNSAT